MRLQLNATNWRDYMVSLSVLLMSLHDFYYVSIGFPIVPVVGVSVLMAAVFAFPPAIESRGTRTQIFVTASLFALVVGSTVLGAAISDNMSIKTPIGVAVGVILMGAVLARGHTLYESLCRAIDRAFKIHVVFWVVQATIGNLTGVVLDYTGFLSENPARYESSLYSSGYSGVLFRYTGLFAEPSIYAMAIFMFLVHRLSRNWTLKNLWDWLALATMVLSFSLSGLALAAIVLAAMLLEVKPRRKGVVLSVVFSVAALGIWLLGVGDTYFVGRVEKLDTDGSANARFSLTQDLISSMPLEKIFFGNGLGTVFDEVGHSSGFADLIIYFGVVGVVAVGVAFWALLRSRGVRSPSLIFLWAMTFWGAPPIVNLIWWAWCGALFMAGRTAPPDLTAPNVAPSATPAVKMA